MASIFLNIPVNKPDGTALSLRTGASSSKIETIITNQQILQAKNLGRVQINAIFLTVYPSHRNAPQSEKLPLHSLISLVVPTACLLSALIAFRVSGAEGWEAVFPSMKTCPIVLKLTTWMTLIAVVVYEQSFYHYSSGGKNLMIEGRGNYEGVEIVVDDGMLTPVLDDGAEYYEEQNVSSRGVEFTLPDDVDQGGLMEDPSKDMLLEDLNLSPSESRDRGNIVLPPDVISEEENTNELDAKEVLPAGSSSSIDKASVLAPAGSSSASLSKTGASPVPIAKKMSTTAQAVNGTVAKTVTVKVKASPQSRSSSKADPIGINARVSPVKTSSPKSASSSSPKTASATKSAPGSIPFRFIRATKGDVAAAKERWAATCKWRAENSMDTCLLEPHPNVKLIKEYYPHYFHLRGKKNECCYYERPAYMNITELKKNGIGLDLLLKHYAICCDYMWEKIENSEEGKSIYVIDLDRLGFRDFAGEVVEFVKKASQFTGDHYPERSGSIFIINVPSWFSVIWNVVKPMVDDVTKAKIKILRYGAEGITKALMEKIDIENIPPEYGGKSMPLGQSPEEIGFMKHFEALN